MTAVRHHTFFVKSLKGEDEGFNMSVFEGFDRVPTTALYRGLLTDMAGRLNLAELSELNKVFVTLDKDNSGSLNEEEVRTGLEENGFPQEEIDKIVHALLGSDKQVCYTAFMGHILGKSKRDLEQQLLTYFHQVDVNHDGALDKEELMQVLSQEHMVETVKMLGGDEEKIIAHMDRDGDGKVTFSEFCDAITGRAMVPTKKIGYQEGQEVEYYSSSFKTWIPAKVTQARKKHVELDVKAGYWFNEQEQKKRVRRRGATTVQTAPEPAPLPDTAESR